MKTCTRCGESKSLEMFAKRSDRPGLRSGCRQCEQARVRERTKRKRKPRVCTLPLSPIPRMDLLESLDCVRLKAWRGPVTPGLVGWRLAA
jgi:hypothetical protein